MSVSTYDFNFTLFVSFIDINECVTHRCEHGATCLDQVNGYICQCVPGYEGQYCEIGRLIYFLLKLISYCNSHHRAVEQPLSSTV